jgi:hypothetical protein
MQIHLYGLHPSLWKIVVVGVTTPPQRRSPHTRA